jgi:hypothetical protein
MGTNKKGPMETETLSLESSKRQLLDTNRIPPLPATFPSPERERLRTNDDRSQELEEIEFDGVGIA